MLSILTFSVVIDPVVFRNSSFWAGIIHVQQGFALCCSGREDTDGKKMFFHFPAAHWKFLGLAWQGQACAAVMEHFASLRHLKGRKLLLLL